MKIVGITLIAVAIGLATGMALGIAHEQRITIDGDFGTVTIVGDDAESFLKSVYPKTF